MPLQVFQHLFKHTNCQESHSASNPYPRKEPRVSSTAQGILDTAGGPDNIAHFTRCVARLRFELNDVSAADKDRIEVIDGVFGAAPQSGDCYQIIISGAV